MINEWFILHTNDIHSDFVAMTRIQTIFRDYAQAYAPSQLLRLDGGDHLDRVDPRTEGSLGQLNVAMMHQMAYDATVIGNNEGLTFMPAQLQQLYQQANFVVTCANLQFRAHPMAWMHAFRVFQRGDLRIGVFGLTAPYETFYRELGWDVCDPVLTARETVAHLRNDHRVDVVIVLSHLGYPVDEALAQQIDGIDLILGGHTHHVLERAVRCGNTWMVAAGRRGSHVSVVRIVRDAGGTLHYEGYARPTATIPPDPALHAWLVAHTAEALAPLEDVVGTLHGALHTDDVREAPLGNVLAAALRQRMGAQIGIVNAGQLLHTLPAGVVTRGQLLRTCPSPINPALITVRGSAIRDALHLAIDETHTLKPFRGFGFRGERLGTLCVDGLTVYVFSHASQWRIARVLVGDEPLDDAQMYTVGTIDMFTFGVGYPSFAQYTDCTYFLSAFLRDVLAEVIGSSDQVHAVAHAKKLRYVFTT